MNPAGKNATAPAPQAPQTIADLLPALDRALEKFGTAVLQAPPGTGKTTVVPLALLEGPWLAGGRILVLEPRRLAARACARWMARSLGEPPGRTVGYRTRLDSRTSPRTRVEVVTEGILTRRIQNDPALSGVGMVVFDEFHERSLQADLGLALCLDARRGLRPDLRLLVMSATMDDQRVAALLDDAPVIRGGRRPFAVETRYLPPRPGRDPAGEAAAAVGRALAEEEGGILVFLPGAGEIRRTAAILEGKGLPPAVDLVPLFGNLPRRQQDAAILPAPAGRRKVVLSTAIAETSLTIRGVRVVVDAGLARSSRFDVRSGMGRLVTHPVSRDVADQRRGRAGRTAPGFCYRLWDRLRHGELPARRRPAILAADLAPLVMEVMLWGVRDPGELDWLDPPPAGAWDQAVDLLGRLGALEGGQRLTPRGRRMAAMGMHPRLAHMVLTGIETGPARLAVELAALLEERDILHTRPGHRDADLRTRVELLRRPTRGDAIDAAARRRIRQVVDRRCRRLSVAGAPPSPAAAGRLLASAYPDRVGRRRRQGEARYRMTGGRGACLDASDPLAAEEFIVAAHLDGMGPDARIHLAAAVGREEIEAAFADRIVSEQVVTWDRRRQAVSARLRRRLERLTLWSGPLERPDAGPVAAAMLAGIRQMGIGVLPWGPAAGLRARIMLLARVGAPAGPWPDLSDGRLAARMETWLSPWLDGITRREHLKRLDMRRILRTMLSPAQTAAIERLAPPRWTVPSGSRVAIDYTDAQAPVLRVRLQEMFGAVETPSLAGGRVPLVLHLLSPAMRPVQITRDLAGFWQNGYVQVRKELRGRYPRHHWPSDPRAARAVRGVRRPKGK